MTAGTGGRSRGRLRRWLQIGFAALVSAGLLATSVGPVFADREYSWTDRKSVV